MPAAKKYFIQEHLHREVFHGGVGNVDAEKIFLSRGYKALTFPGTFDFSLLSKLNRLLYLIRLFFTISSCDLVVFQFPLYARVHELLIKLLRIKGVPVICLILDIEGLRDGNKALLEKDKKALQQFTLFIVHNERMQQWLLPLAPHAAIVQLQFFDFLTTPAQQQRVKDRNIVFAGNLEKSPFVYKLGELTRYCPTLSFSIYGPGLSGADQLPENVAHKGVYPPYELVQLVKGSFGLVWDGPDIESCTGNYGSYLALNSPHKLSLYIMTGIPLLVPEMSASAALVKQYGIGCTIHSLLDLEKVIDSISEQQYHLMVENMRPLARQLSQGYFLTKALDQLDPAPYEN